MRDSPIQLASGSNPSPWKMDTIPIFRRSELPFTLSIEQLASFEKTFPAIQVILDNEARKRILRRFS